MAKFTAPDSGGLHAALRAPAGCERLYGRAALAQRRGVPALRCAVAHKSEPANPTVKKPHLREVQKPDTTAGAWKRFQEVARHVVNLP